MAVAFDTHASSTGTSGSSISYSTGSVAGSDRLLIVSVESLATNPVTSITHDGTSLSIVGSATNGYIRTEFWKLVSPATGVKTVVVNFTNTLGATSGAATSAISLTGCPGGNVAFSGKSILPVNFTETLISADAGANDLTIDAIGSQYKSLAITVDGSQTQLVNTTLDSRPVGVSYKTGATVHMRWTKASGGDAGGAHASVVCLAEARTLHTGLVSHYNFDESSAGSSPVTRNDAFSTNHLTDGNNAASTTGKLSNAVDFVSGETDYLYILDGSQTGYDITGDISISFWYKPTSFPSAGSAHSFFTKWSTSGGAQSYLFALTNNGGNKRFMVQYTNSGTYGSAPYGNAQITDSAEGLSTGNWYHVVMIFKPSIGSLQAYVDNVDKGTNTTTAMALYSGSGDVRVGYDAGYGPFKLDAVIDHLSIYARELTATEVAYLYGSGTPPAFPFVSTPPPHTPGTFIAGPLIY